MKSNKHIPKRNFFIIYYITLIAELKKLYILKITSVMTKTSANLKSSSKKALELRLFNCIYMIFSKQTIKLFITNRHLVASKTSQVHI